MRNFSGNIHRIRSAFPILFNSILFFFFFGGGGVRRRIKSNRRACRAHYVLQCLSWLNCSLPRESQCQELKDLPQVCFYTALAKYCGSQGYPSPRPKFNRSCFLAQYTAALSRLLEKAVMLKWLSLLLSFPAGG